MNERIQQKKSAAEQKEIDDFRKMMSGIEDKWGVPDAPEGDEDLVNIDTINQFITSLESDENQEITFEKFRAINAKLKEIESLQKITASTSLSKAEIKLKAIRDQKETEAA